MAIESFKSGTNTDSAALDGKNETQINSDALRNQSADLLSMSANASDAKTSGAEPPIVMAMHNRRTHGGHEPEERQHHSSHSHHSKHERRPPTYEERFEQYWGRVTKARSNGGYLSEFPPVHPGIDKPAPISAESHYLPKQSSLPSLADMIMSSKELNRAAFNDKKLPDFNLLELNENEFKQRYVHEAMRVGKQFNVSKDNMQEIVQRIYAFEDGGWGTYNTLSNTPQWMTEGTQDPATKEKFLSLHPASTAIGYNQLLMLDTIRNIDSHSGEIAARLDALAQENPARAEELSNKAKLVRGVHDQLDQQLKAMAHHKSGSFSATESLYAEFAKSGGLPKAGMSPKKLACAIQAFNLDGDIGPIIQSQEIFNLLQYQQEKGFPILLKELASTLQKNAAVFDGLSAEQKATAVSELMGMMRPIPVEGVASTAESEKQFQDTKESMTKRLLQMGPGVSDALAREKLSEAEFRMLNVEILTQRRFGGEFGPLSLNTTALLNKIMYSHLGGPTAENLMPPALELANLAGTGKGFAMLKPENASLPTSNFFQHDGYQRNPMTSRRSASELLFTIDRVMHGPNSFATKPGNSAFIDAFKNEKD